MHSYLHNLFMLSYLTLFFHIFVQAVFTDQPQVAYIQQDGTTQQVTDVSVVFCLLVFLKINIM